MRPAHLFRRRPPARRRMSSIDRTVEALEERQLLATFFVNNTNDSGPGSLRQAILDANLNTGQDNIEFRILAQDTDPDTGKELPGVPAPGFDLGVQTWRIALDSPLPRITDTLHIDAYSQAHSPVQFYYPDDEPGRPTLITSQPSNRFARDGNNVRVRVILDGSKLDSAISTVGFEIGASHSILRGFAIEGFDVGVSVPDATTEGVLIQGNSIGVYTLYPVDQETGNALTGSRAVEVSGAGNSYQGILIGAKNTMIGGLRPQDSNIIAGNGAEGILILPGAPGNQIFGNQIGVVGPSDSGYYRHAGNGSDGIRIESASNHVGGLNTFGGFNSNAGNVISVNQGHGVHLVGVGATRNRIEGNFIGVAPGGGHLFGASDPGNLGDGVRINDAPENTIGAAGAFGTGGAASRNVISANQGAGIHILGPLATGNWITNNHIGTDAEGRSPLGNSAEGILIETSGATVEGNLISGNLKGVRIAGTEATRNIVRDNRIGTEVSGMADLGNAQEGILIDGAPNNLILGDGAGSQLISGNAVGVAIAGVGAWGNQVIGNYIGANVDGTRKINNSFQGVLIDDAPASTIGGTTGVAGNLILGNHWGVEIRGAGAVDNHLMGNRINESEVHGVLITAGASGNAIGGLAGGAGNTIFRNRHEGVRIEAGHRNAILGNRIWANGGLGIDLLAGANQDQQAPVLDAVVGNGAVVSVGGRIHGRAGTSYTVEVFASADKDPSGFGEGEVFLGRSTVTTDAEGVGYFSVEVQSALLATPYIAATATDPDGNTSEFSATTLVGVSEFRFEVPADLVDESMRVATFYVLRTGVTTGRASVAYRVVGGSATAGRDFANAGGILTFEPGDTRLPLTIDLIGDDLVEGDETLILALADPTDAATLGTPSIATLTIQDDDQHGVHFGAATAAVTERGTATIVVTRTGTTGAASVSYFTAGGSATPGLDYRPAAGILHFALGQAVATFTVTTLDDELVEGDETVGIFLSAPEGLALVEPAAAILTIRDDDRPGTIQFAVTDVVVRESDGVATVIVTRTGGATGTVTVAYTTAGGNATPGVDYQPVAGTLVFGPGETSRVVTIPILDDAQVEGTEWFLVVLGAATGGAAQGPQSLATVLIFDDDFDRTPPTVTGVQPILEGGRLAALAVSFSELLDPARAADLYNYDPEIVSAGRDGRFGTVDDTLHRLGRVVYDAALSRVLLLPDAPLAANRLYRIHVNRLVVPGVGTGVADLAGNLLDGDGDGLAGGAYLAVVDTRTRPAAPGARPVPRPPVAAPPRVRPVVPRPVPVPPGAPGRRLPVARRPAVAGNAQTPVHRPVAPAWAGGKLPLVSTSPLARRSVAWRGR